MNRSRYDFHPVGRSWGKGRSTHHFSGPLAQRNSPVGYASKPYGFHNRFDVLDIEKRKKNSGRWNEQEQQHDEFYQNKYSTRFFPVLYTLQRKLRGFS